MSAIRLLVLGALRQHDGRAHGYQIRNDLEYWGAHEWSTAGLGSIYHALRQMTKEGHLHEHEVAPSTAGGPPRTEYELTEQGRREYLDLLRETLRSPDRRADELPAALGCMTDLPRDEVTALLGERLAGIAAWRTRVTDVYLGPGDVSHGHIGEIMDFWLHSADAQTEWTKGLITRIEGGEYVFAGEGEPFVGVLREGETNPYV